MPVEIKMPQMGESITEGTVIKWFVSAGDQIERDEPLFEISTDKVDTETYKKFNRAVKEAVKQIKANRSEYMHYFLDYYKDKDPKIAAMEVGDLMESRVVLVDPAPIPQQEANRTAAWIKSWGMLAETDEAAELINMEVQQSAHAAAE